MNTSEKTPQGQGPSPPKVSPRCRFTIGCELLAVGSPVPASSSFCARTRLRPRLRLLSRRRFLWRLACQAFPLNRLGEGAQTPEAAAEKLRGWQENTNSIFYSRSLAGRTQQM